MKPEITVGHYASHKAEGVNSDRLRELIQTQTRIGRLEGMLSGIALQLDLWASESRSGGWSTHQVDAQRNLAAKIRAIL